MEYVFVLIKDSGLRDIDEIPESPEDLFIDWAVAKTKHGIQPSLVTTLFVRLLYTYVTFIYSFTSHTY